MLRLLLSHTIRRNTAIRLRWIGGVKIPGEAHARAGAKIPEIETHPKPSSKRVQNVSFQTFFSHLKGGVRDPPLLSHTIRKK